MDHWGMISRGSMDHWSMISRGSMDNRGMICRGSMDNRGMISRGGMDNACMVGGGSMNNRGSMDNWGMISWSSMDSWSSSIAGDSFIGDILDVSRVSISAIVDNLSPAIRKSHPVAARGGVTISLLLLSKVISTVVVTHSILVGVHWGLIIHWLGGTIGHRGGRGSSDGSGEDENLHVCRECLKELIPRTLR